MHIPLTPPPYDDLISSIPADRFTRVLASELPSVPGAEGYPHWDTIVHLPPPSDLTHAEWWLRLKIQREAGRRRMPLLDVKGRPFTVSLPDAAAEMLHSVDQKASGRIRMAESVTNPASRDRYVISSLIEEAITSSQLEGASTTRRVAKEMLRTGRTPRGRSERMISNNYRAMQYVSANRAVEITPARIFELHRIVTLGTLDDPTAAGRLQRPEEERVQVWGEADQLLHTPPPAEELPQRLAAFCSFANGQSSEGWMHPVVRAIVMHFWIGYDHYFEDGNGRTARAIFYWAMLKQDYWLTEFLTISTILRKAPITYAQSFLLSETDDNDLTYFLVYNLGVLKRALASLEEYLERKIQEVQEVEALVRGDSGLNHRQRALLGDALRDAQATYTIHGHQIAHGVVYQTARSDLLELADRGLLNQRRAGKVFIFTPAEDLGARLRQLA
jgi:Fic family protein